MRTIVFLAGVVLVAACGAPEPAASPPSTASSATAVASTTVPPGTSTPMFFVEPIDDDWAPVDLTWGVQPSCCDQPAIGPASPEGAIPLEGWPADGFYDVTVTRVGDPPGALEMAIRRWVPCAELPGRCSPDPPEGGIGALESSEAVTVVFLEEELTVVIRPLQPVAGGPAPAITGSGRALYQLLSGFCGGSLPPRNPINCGIDHAVIDWMLEPYQAGATLIEIDREIRRRETDPGFPLEHFDDGSSGVPCSVDRSCPVAYRAPHGARLVLVPSQVEEADGFPGYLLYGWWASLEIRDGRPILYLDAGRIAG